MEAHVSFLLYFLSLAVILRFAETLHEGLEAFPIPVGFGECLSQLFIECFC